MKRILTCFFRIGFWIFAFANGLAWAQTDSIPVKKERYGLRVGADAYKFARSFYDHDYRGIELVGDFRISRNYYLAAELGTENAFITDERVKFTTKGSYIKAGIDINMYENWLDMENLIYLGFRYSFSTFSHELDSYQIYQGDPYLGEAPPVLSDRIYNNLTAHWLELVLGVKAELINNVYAGFSVRLHRMISVPSLDNFDNLYVTGFNKVTEGSPFGVSFNYTLTYFIPVFKKAVPKKDLK